MRSPSAGDKNVSRSQKAAISRRRRPRGNSSQAQPGDQLREEPQGPVVALERDAFIGQCPPLFLPAGVSLADGKKPQTARSWRRDCLLKAPQQQDAMALNFLLTSLCLYIIFTLPNR